MTHSVLERPISSSYRDAGDSGAADSRDNNSPHRALHVSAYHSGDLALWHQVHSCTRSVGGLLDVAISDNHKIESEKRPEARVSSALDAPARKEIIDDLIKNIRKNYISRDVGKQMETALRKNLADGHYRAIWGFPFCTDSKLDRVAFKLSPCSSQIPPVKRS
jgi:hypothetical protein